MLGMYTIYDKVKKEITNVMIYKNDEDALRAYNFAMINLMKDENSVTHPNDYKIIKIAEIDPDTGDVYTDEKCPEELEWTLEENSNE